MQRTFYSVLILACLVLVACGNPERAKQEYVQQAEIYLKNKDYVNAIVQLRNAVRVDPKSGAIRLSLARAYERTGQMRQARQEFVRAADLMPSDKDAQLGAARLLLLNGDFEDAKTRAQGVLKLDPKNSEAHLVRGRAAAGMDDLSGALSAFEDGISLEPKGVDLLINRGQLRAIQGNEQEAEASFKQAIVVAPDSLDARLALADFYWFSGKMPLAERALKDAAALNDPEGRAARTLAAFYISTNRNAEAEAPLRRAIAVNPDPRLKLFLAEFLTSTKRESEAAPILEALARDPKTRSAATVRLATLEFAKAGHGKAYSLLDELLSTEVPKAEGLTRKAQFLVADGKKQEAMAAVQAAMKADPTAAPAFELAGKLYMERLEFDPAETALREALRLDNKAVNAMLALASVNLARQRADQATELAERALQTQPGNGEAQLMLVRALTAAGNVERAHTELARLESANAPVQAALGTLEARQGNKPAARAAYQRALDFDPKSSEALRGLVQIDTTDNKVDGAVQRINKALAESPKDAELLLLSARTQAAAGNLANAEAQARQALDLDPAQRSGYDLLGQIYRRQNKLDEAQRVFERVTKERPSDVPAHTMVGILQLVRGDETGARTRFEKVLSIDPRAAVASNNLAYMDAEAGTNLDEALNRAQAAKAALPDDPVVDDTLGWIYVKKGLPALAQNPLNEAVKKDKNNSLYWYHLGKAYAGMGDNARARTTLEAALKLSPNFPGANDAKKTLDALPR